LLLAFFSGPSLMATGHVMLALLVLLALFVATYLLAREHGKTRSNQRH
jgi:hypothetical protein